MDNLPSEGYVHVLSASSRRRDLLFVGTETGLYVTIDGGERWQALRGGLPTVPIHDLILHPRDRELVIVTHGRLAEEFVLAMEHVVGPQRGVEAICIGPEDDMERRRQDILAAVDRVNDGDGVILLTDMFGGTPSNLAISVMDQTRAEVIAGLNLPMLIKLASVRGRENLQTCVAHAQDAGRKYISVASYVLAGEK